MADHKCEAWTLLGINCPVPLMQAYLGEQNDLLDEPEADLPESVGVPAFPGHRKAKAAKTEVSDSTLAILMELFRRSQLPELLERAVPGPARIPVEIGREAYASGARGRELALWVGAAAVSLAIGLRFGPSVAQNVPRILLEGLTGRPGAPPGRGGFGGLRFNASRQLRQLLQGGGGRSLGGFVGGIAGGFGFGAGELP